MKRTILLTTAGFILLLSLVMLLPDQNISQTKPDELNQTVFESPIEPTPTQEGLSPQVEIALAYVAEKYALPKESLIIANQHDITYELIGQKYKAFTIWFDTPEEFQQFNFLVDRVDGHIEEDVNAVDAREKSAYREKFGKLQPDLYERIQTMGDQDVVSVAIIVVGSAETQTQQQRFALLAEKYPAAAESIKTSRVPWAVDDQNLAEQIRQDYLQMMRTDALQVTEPIVSQLRELGYDAETADGMASIAATLPKSIILEIQKREDVETIYLTDYVPTASMSEAAATNRMPIEWYSTLTGVGRKIAILEPTNIQNTGCLNNIPAADIRNANAGAYNPNHKTWVASSAACNNNNLRGIGYNANLIDAAFDFANDNPDFGNALSWAFGRGAEIVNMSLRFGSGNNIQWYDRVADYWARQGYMAIVVASGNDDSTQTIFVDSLLVGSPGKGWNTISVGAITDNGNSNWSDDDWMDEATIDSSYLNPDTDHDDHEKPDIAAPGANISVIGPGGGIVNGLDGSSLAAPQVSGLIALLINRNPYPSVWTRPEVARAILMASAVHNVRDSRVITIGTDLRDGAGAIDAKLALQLVDTGYISPTDTTCDKPCWWATDDISVPPGGVVTRKFKAVRGERVRVAISWWSNVVSPTSNLYTHYDLEIKDPSNNFATASATWDNSNEVVEFVTLQTGEYTIRIIRRNDDSNVNESVNQIGIAWTKQATYLPDIPRTDATWQSKIYVRNEDPTAQLSQVTYCRHVGNGNSVSCENGPNPTINANHLYSTTPAVNSSMDSVIVDGSESLASLARIFKNNEAKTWLDNGFRAAAADPAFEQVAQTLYIPAFYKNSFGTNTTVYIQNMGVTPATFTANFYGRTGYIDHLGKQPGGTIPAQGVWYAVGGNITDTTWVGSLRITATQPILAQAWQTTSGYAASFNAAAVGSTVIPVVAAYKKAFSLSTGLIIQNLGTVPTNVKLTYCPPQPANPNICPNHTPINNLQPNRAVGFALETATLPAGVVDGWQGSIKVESTANQPLAVAVNIIKRNAANAVTGGYNYNATAYAGRLVVLPYAARQDGVKYTGYRVHNPNGNTITVTARYYRSDGTPSWTRSIVLQPAWIAGFSQGVTANPADDWHNGIDNGWEGSIVLSADTGPLLVVMREDQPDAANRDVLAGYGGIVLSQ